MWEIKYERISLCLIHLHTSTTFWLSNCICGVKWKAASQTGNTPHKLDGRRKKKKKKNQDVTPILSQQSDLNIYRRLWWCRLGISVRVWCLLKQNMGRIHPWPIISSSLYPVKHTFVHKRTKHTVAFIKNATFHSVLTLSTLSTPSLPFFRLREWLSPGQRYCNLFPGELERLIRRSGLLSPVSSLIKGPVQQFIFPNIILIVLTIKHWPFFSDQSN